LSCLVLSCLVLSCLVLSCLVLSCLVLSCLVLSCLVLLMSVTLHTSLGDLKCELFVDLVPRSSKNFLALCAQHRYDETIFHRNMKGFCIQGGDISLNDATIIKGGSTYTGGLLEDEIRQEVQHSHRGIIAMANRGSNTAASQFYICYAACAHLNGINTIIGQVIDGWETLDKMEAAAVDKKNRPIEAIRILAVTIHANPIAEQEYK